MGYEASFKAKSVTPQLVWVGVADRRPDTSSIRIKVGVELNYPKDTGPAGGDCLAKYSKENSTIII